MVKGLTEGCCDEEDRSHYQGRKTGRCQSALESYGYFGMTVTEVSGRGRQGGLTLQWRVGEYKVDLLPKIKVEVVVLDEDVAKILNAITSQCADR